MEALICEHLLAPTFPSNEIELVSRHRRLRQKSPNDDNLQHCRPNPNASSSRPNSPCPIATRSEIPHAILVPTPPRPTTIRRHHRVSRHPRWPRPLVRDPTPFAKLLAAFESRAGALLTQL